MLSSKKRACKILERAFNFFVEFMFPTEELAFFSGESLNSTHICTAKSSNVQPIQRCVFDCWLVPRDTHVMFIKQLELGVTVNINKTIQPTST